MFRDLECAGPRFHPAGRVAAASRQDAGQNPGPPAGRRALRKKEPRIQA